jgi:signal transduction histidine kinase
VTEALRTANHKLHILSDITRHDIRNQLTAIRGYLELDLMNAGDPARIASINKERQIAGTIDDLIQFTKQYEDLGLFEPAWIALQNPITSVTAESTKNNIELIDMTGPFEVYADPLFGKVFFNLIDNAERHGGHVTRIKFSTQRDGNDLLLICEDNGAGIADDHKEKIFDKGFGTNTGLGLFFVHEILSITGLTITENGNPGAGARFVIRVPAGKFREAIQDS